MLDTVTAGPRPDTSGPAPMASATERPLDELERDEEGFLLDVQDWYPALMDALAEEADLELTPERRAVIVWVRDYFERNDSVPEARVLLKHLARTWGPERATRRALYQLFPRGYGQQACKLAGMTKPRKLMLDV